VLGAWASWRSSTDAQYGPYEGAEHDILFQDLGSLTLHHLGLGISESFFFCKAHLPGFDAFLPDQLEAELAQAAFALFIEWNWAYVQRRPSPLANASMNPPRDLVFVVKLIVEREPTFERNTQALTQGFCEALWDFACTAFHPERFDYFVTLGGRGIRKAVIPVTTPTSIPPKLEDAVRIYVNGITSSPHWLGRFHQTKTVKLKKHLSVDVHQDERSTVADFLCPRYFVLEADMIVPNDELLDKASRDVRPYLVALWKLMATLTPRTTILLLRKVNLLGEKIGNRSAKARVNLENHRSTSVTKQKGLCIGCGTAARETELMKCSRCRVARYCKCDHHC
jgi:hypothetical protein